MPTTPPGIKIKERNKNNLFVPRCMRAQTFFCWPGRRCRRPCLLRYKFCQYIFQKSAEGYFFTFGEGMKKIDTEKYKQDLLGGGGDIRRRRPLMQSNLTFFPFFSLSSPPPPPPGNRKWFREFEIIHITRFPARINRRSIHNRRRIASHRIHFVGAGCGIHIGVGGAAAAEASSTSVWIVQREKNIGGIRWSHISRHLRFLNIQLAPFTLPIPEAQTLKLRNNFSTSMVIWNNFLS